MTAEPEQPSPAASLRTGQPGNGKTIGVIGAGAVGVTAAADLATAGADVTLYERDTVGGTERGDAASLRAAGVVYDAHSTVTDAFLTERSITRFKSLATTSDRFRFERCPYVIIVSSEDRGRADALRTTAGRMQQSNRRVQIVDADRLGDRFPELKTDDLSLGLIAENAGRTDPASYVDAVAHRARNNGVEMVEGVKASVETDPLTVATDEETHRFDSVLIAAGAHTRKLCVDAGQPVPVKPYRVQAVVGDHPYRGPMCFDATSGFYFRPHPDGVLIGDGTEPFAADPDDWDRSADEWFCREVSSRFEDRTGCDFQVLDSWAGLCTATPDGDPLLGELTPELYVAAGWQGHGFMRAPGVAERIAARMLGVSDVPDAFRPTRFDGTETFEISEGMAIDPE